MRERQRYLEGHIPFYRITPAHAGKTSRKCRIDWFCWDHPRACGKDSSSSIHSLSLMGSPPRMRERPILALCCVSERGITPAHAGKTALYRSSALFFEDHPRACGKGTFITLSPSDHPALLERPLPSSLSLVRSPACGRHREKQRRWTGHPRCGKNTIRQIAILMDPPACGKTTNKLSFIPGITPLLGKLGLCTKPNPVGSPAAERPHKSVYLLPDHPAHAGKDLRSLLIRVPVESPGMRKDSSSKVTIFFAVTPRCGKTATNHDCPGEGSPRDAGKTGKAAERVTVVGSPPRMRERH